MIVTFLPFIGYSIVSCQLEFMARTTALPKVTCIFLTQNKCQKHTRRLTSHFTLQGYLSLLLTIILIDCISVHLVLLHVHAFSNVVDELTSEYIYRKLYCCLSLYMGSIILIILSVLGIHEPWRKEWIGFSSMRTLRSYCDEIEIRSREEIPFSLWIPLRFVFTCRGMIHSPPQRRTFIKFTSRQVVSAFHFDGFNSKHCCLLGRLIITWVQAGSKWQSLYIRLTCMWCTKSFMHEKL